MRARRAVLAAFALLFLVQWTRAQVSPTVLLPTTRSTDSWDAPTCGIQAMYCAARSLGIEPSYDSMNLPQFVSDAEGSTFADLTACAEEMSLSALSVSRLTVLDLKTVTPPVILHVRANPWSEKPDHFLCFLGFRKDAAIVVDPAVGMLSCSPTFLASRWNGDAILVARTRDFRVAESVMLPTNVVLLGLLVSLFLLRAISRHLRGAGRRMRTIPTMVLLGVAVGSVGVCWHRLNPGGLLFVKSATQEIDEWHTDYFLPQVSKAKLQQMLHSESAQLVDARSSEEWTKDGIPGSINVPATDAMSRRSGAFGSISQKHPIVVYCSNEHCRAARIVAQIMRSEGVPNVYHYSAGVDDWYRGN